MTIFKNYFKIVKTSLPSIILITAIFITFGVLVNSSPNSTESFLTVKPNIAIENYDNSKITDSLIEYLKQNNEIKELEKNESAKKDALFYRVVDYILIIPEGFGKSIIDNNSKTIETMKIPDSTTSFYTETLLNRFLNSAQIYANTGMNEIEISSNLSNTFKKDSSVQMVENKNNETGRIKFYYNFSNYSILAVSIMVIGMMMSSFHNRPIKHRHNVSKTTSRRMNTEITCGNGVLIFLIWLTYAIVAFIMFQTSMCSITGVLYLVNSFLLCLVALAIGSLVGALVHNKEAQNGIINVFALGTSFICGAFVPQSFLGESVLKFAHLFPSYYFIENNERLGEIVTFSKQTLQPILINFGILFLFAFGIFILTNIIIKLKQKES